MSDFTERVVFCPGNPLFLVVPNRGEAPISMDEAGAILAFQALGVEALIAGHLLVPESIPKVQGYINEILDLAVSIGLTDLPL